MKKSTVRNHYLPRTYLKHFLLNDEMYMYKKGEQFFVNEKTAEDRIIKVQGEKALSGIGLKKKLYDPQVEGVSSDDLEEIFRGYGEDYFNDLVDEIHSIGIGGSISDEIKQKLSYFIASMRVRTPQFKYEIEEMDNVFRKHFSSRQFEQLTPQDLVDLNKNEFDRDISIEDATHIKDMIVNQDYDLKYPNGYFIKWALMLLNHHADIFMDMSMMIFISDGRYFITTDNPVVFFVPPEKVNFYNSPRALVNPSTELFFPITKDIGVTLNWQKIDERIMEGKRSIVNTFNDNISYNSFDFLFSPIKMKGLNKFVESHIPYPFKFSIK